MSTRTDLTVYGLAKPVSSVVSFLRTLVLPMGVEHWSLTPPGEKLVKIGARMVRPDHYYTLGGSE